MKNLIWLLVVFFYHQGISQVSWISVEGNQFVNEDGQKVVFRGFNASDPDKLESSGHWNMEYFSKIKEWGGNVVRFPIHPTAWRKRGKDAYLELIDSGVEMAKSNDLYVILDWHSIGNLKSELFFLPIYETSRKETFDFWRTMAERYGNDPTVAFFEIFNEPTTFNGRLGQSSWKEWKSLMEEAITIIRAYGARNIPLVAGFNWAYDLSVIRHDPIDAPGIAYVSHPYPQKRQKPWEEKWEEDWGYVSDTHPVILTEIGFCEAGEKGAHVPVIDDGQYVEAIFDYTDKKGISFVVWVFDPNWSPMLIEDWTYTPTKAGAVWKNAFAESIK